MFRSTRHQEIPENRWLSLFELGLLPVDANQYQWLSDHDSMTERLDAYGLDPLTIQVKEARHQPARAEERHFLELPERNWPFVREVLMQVDGRPWLFGRTIVPGETLQHQGRRLKMLKNRPLGEVLFDCEQPSRAFIEVAAINSEHWLYPDDPALLSSTDDESRLLWARRSLFYFNGKPLLVQEVFLPSCPFKRPDAD